MECPVCGRGIPHDIALDQGTCFAVRGTGVGPGLWSCYILCHPELTGHTEHCILETPAYMLHSETWAIILQDAAHALNQRPLCEAVSPVGGVHGPGG